MKRKQKSPSARGYTAAWAKASKAYRKANPLCVDCQRRGILTAATDVDHIRPWRGDRSIFWQESNWQALCKPCHAKKTAVDNGSRKALEGCDVDGNPAIGWAEGLDLPSRSVVAPARAGETVAKTPRDRRE